MDNNTSKKSRGLGFWLLVIGIVVVAVAIAIPNFKKARTLNGLPNCLNNLRQIKGAKDAWVIESKQEVGAAVSTNLAVQYIKGGMLPTCPSGGTYSWNSVGENPTCSIGGPSHSLPSPEIISTAPTNRTNVVP